MAGAETNRLIDAVLGAGADFHPRSSQKLNGPNGEVAEIVPFTLNRNSGKSGRNGSVVTLPPNTAVAVDTKQPVRMLPHMGSAVTLEPTAGGNVRVTPLRGQSEKFFTQARSTSVIVVSGNEGFTGFRYYPYYPRRRTWRSSEEFSTKEDQQGPIALTDRLTSLQDRSVPIEPQQK